MTKQIIIFILVFLFTPIISIGTTFIIQPVEEVIKQSDLIVEARIVSIENFPISRSTLGYSLITLEIYGHLKGESPKRIVLKRYGINQTGKQLFGEYKPIFQLNERVIVCLSLPAP